MDAVRDLFMNKGKTERFLDFDGYRLDQSDWWLNIRPSNTEPYLRFLCEAKSDAKLQEIINTVKEIVKKWS
jgi:phosphomannomutase